jgi:hypothetical protein
MDTVPLAVVDKNSVQHWLAELMLSALTTRRDQQWIDEAIASESATPLTGAGFDRQKQYSLEDARHNKSNKKQSLVCVSRVFC